MAAIDHDVAGSTGFSERILGELDMHRVVVRPFTASAQNDVRVAVPAGGENGNLSLAESAD